MGCEGFQTKICAYLENLDQIKATISTSIETKKNTKKI